MSVQASVETTADALQRLTTPDEGEASEEPEELVLTVTEASPGWTFVLGELVPGLGEALSLELGVTVATWFADSSAQIARLEIRRQGAIAGYYPGRLGLHPARVDPAELAGSAEGMREAARAAAIPIAWDPPAGAKGVQVRLLL